MTEIMPVPRNLILLSYQQGAFRRAFFFYFVQRAFNCSAVMAQPSAMY